MHVPIWSDNLLLNFTSHNQQYYNYVIQSNSTSQYYSDCLCFHTFIPIFCCPMLIDFWSIDMDPPDVSVNCTCCNASGACDPLKCERQLVMRTLDVANKTWVKQENWMPACTGVFFLISWSAIFVLKHLTMLALLMKQHWGERHVKFPSITCYIVLCPSCFSGDWTLSSFFLQWLSTERL